MGHDGTDLGRQLGVEVGQEFVGGRAGYAALTVGYGAVEGIGEAVAACGARLARVHHVE